MGTLRRLGRLRRPAWAAAACAWLVGGFAGVTAAPEVLSAWLVPLCWLAYLGGLGALMSRLGDRGGVLVAMVMVAPLLAVYFLCAVEVRHDFLLRDRGHEVHATVTDNRVTSPRGHLISHYSLEHPDGTPVKGGEASDGLDLRIGQRVTILEDPRGELAPTTPGHADPTTGFAVLTGLLAVGVGAVVWAAYSRKLAAGMRPEPPPPPYVPEDGQLPVGEALDAAERDRLHAELRSATPTPYGYRTINPARYPGLSYPAAARIAAEHGLQAEAATRDGYWHFAATVTEQVHPS